MALWVSGVFMDLRASRQHGKQQSAVESVLADHRVLDTNIPGRKHTIVFRL